MAAFVDSSSSSDIDASETEILVCPSCAEEKNECCSVCEIIYGFMQINRSSTLKKVMQKCPEQVTLTAEDLDGVPKEIHCPFTVCKESLHPDVPFEKFTSHLTNDHRVTSAPQGDTVFTREMYVGKGNIWRFKRDGPKSPFLLHCYNFQFIQHSFCANGNFWFWISILGSKKDADKFKTVLTMSHPSIRNRKMTWTGNVHPVNTTENDVRHSSQCLILQKSILDDYMDVENDKMLWKLKIEIGFKDDVQDSDFISPDENQDNRNMTNENSRQKPQRKQQSKGKRRKNKN